MRGARASWWRMAAARRYAGGSVVGVALAVLPVLALGGAGSPGVGVTSAAQPRALPSSQQAPHTMQLPPVVRNALPPVLNVDGSLPQPPRVQTLYVATVPEGPLGIPSTALHAYRKAAEILNREQPGCHIDWALIAGIGRIESNHARGGYVDAEGNTREPILGPVLDGTGNTAAIPDTDNGELDGSTTWDRAVGPMQFIPSTWQRYAADANGDGVADPHNLYDSALAAGRYLCSGGVDLADPDQLRAAVFRYNHSVSYVAEVLAWAEAYRTGVKPTPDSEVPLAVPTRGGVRPTPDAVSLAGAAPEPDGSADAGTPRSTLPPTSTAHEPRGSSSTGTSTTTSTTTLPSTSTSGTTSTSTTTTTTTTTTTPTTTPTSSSTSSDPPSCTSSMEPPTSTSTTSPTSTTESTPTTELAPTTSPTPTSSSTTSTEDADPCDTATASAEATLASSRD